MSVVQQELSEPLALACLEVWGGNQPVYTALRVPGLDVWVYGKPHDNAQAGGDVHFVSSCGTGRIARLMVADVAGHGQVVAQTANTLRGLIQRYMNHVDQTRFVQDMNREFTAVQEGRFATAVVLTYFSPDNELAICNAGHPLPMLYRRDKAAWRYLDAQAGATEDNIPLGIMGEVAYEQFRVKLRAGDLMLCYTDSLVESVCQDGSLLGTERLLELVRTVLTEDPSRMIHHLLAKLALQGATLNDDVTLMLMRSTGPSRGAGFPARLRALGRFLGQVALCKRNIPWPELSKKTLGLRWGK